MILVSIIICNELFLFKTKGNSNKMNAVIEELKRLESDIQCDLNDINADSGVTVSSIVEMFIYKAKLEGINLTKVNVDVSISFDISAQVLCKYCDKPNGSDDEDVLCSECREQFGHGYFSEL